MFDVVDLDIDGLDVLERGDYRLLQFANIHQRGPVSLA